MLITSTKQNNSIIQQFKQHGTNKFTRKEIIFMGHRPSHPRLKWNVLKVLRHVSQDPYYVTINTSHSIVLMQLVYPPFDLT